MVAAHVEKINQHMLCVTGVYLRVINTIFVILHLNVSHVSVCSSCLDTLHGACLLHSPSSVVIYSKPS